MLCSAVDAAGIATIRSRKGICFVVEGDMYYPMHDNYYLSMDRLVVMKRHNNIIIYRKDYVTERDDL